jgi:hypothetical protein
MEFLLAAAVVFLHMVLCMLAMRLVPKGIGMGAVLLLGLVALGLVVIAAAWLVFSLEFWTFAAFYFAGTMAYLFLYAGLYKSLSVRILCDLLRRPQRSLSMEALYADYILADTLVRRLGVLRQLGMVRHTAEGHALTGRGRIIASAFSLFQRLYRIGATG